MLVNVPRYSFDRERLENVQSNRLQSPLRISETPSIHDSLVIPRAYISNYFLTNIKVNEEYMYVCIYFIYPGLRTDGIFSFSDQQTT